MAVHEVSIPVYFARFYLVSYPQQFEEDPRLKWGPEGDLAVSARDGLGLNSVTSEHHARVRLEVFDSVADVPPELFSQQPRYSFNSSSDTIALLDTENYPALEVPAPATGMISCAVACEGWRHLQSTPPRTTREHPRHRTMAHRHLARTGSTSITTCAIRPGCEYRDRGKSVNKPTAATVRRVTSEWAEAFPGFDVWRKLRLLRRIGPVLQGICLERTTSGDEYFATAHVHALTSEFPVISLMLNQRLLSSSGQPERLRFARHEAEFRSAAARLSDQSKLSLGEAPSLEQIVRGYHSAAVHRQAKGHPPAVLEMRDSILTAAAAGRKDLVEEGLRLADELANVWPKSRLPLDWESKAVWLAELTFKANDPDALWEVVEGQIAKHELEKIRVV